MWYVCIFTFRTITVTINYYRPVLYWMHFNANHIRYEMFKILIKTIWSAVAAVCAMANHKWLGLGLGPGLYLLLLLLEIFIHFYRLLLFLFFVNTTVRLYNVAVRYRSNWCGLWEVFFDLVISFTMVTMNGVIFFSWYSVIWWLNSICD